MKNKVRESIDNTIESTNNITPEVLIMCIKHLAQGIDEYSEALAEMFNSLPCKEHSKRISKINKIVYIAIGMWVLLASLISGGYFNRNNDNSMFVPKDKNIKSIKKEYKTGE